MTLRLEIFCNSSANDLVEHLKIDGKEIMKPEPLLVFGRGNIEFLSLRTSLSDESGPFN